MTIKKGKLLLDSLADLPPICHTITANDQGLAKAGYKALQPAG